MEPKQRKLRIALWYNLPSGGSKRQVYDHVSGLKARGHEVVGFHPPAQSDYLSLSEVIEDHEVALDAPDVPNRTAFERTLFFSREARVRRAAMRRHSEEAGRKIEAGGFDVLFANTCQTYHSPWIGRYVGIPKLLYLNEPRRPLYEATFGSPWPALPEPQGPQSLVARLKHLNHRITNEGVVHACRRQVADEVENAESYDRILVNSNYSRETILRAYAMDTDVCYLGIDAERFQNLGLAREPYVISVGFMGPSKNPEFIIRAIGSIQTKRPPLVWVANAATPGYREKAEALAKDLGVNLTVHLNIADAELRDLLNRASVFAYAPRLEPFGYAPVEANACGIPAVVVSEGGVKESVTNGVNGIVVPNRPEAMGNAIANLLADPEQMRAMGERAAAHVREHWSLDRATDDLERNLVEVAALRSVG